jgi:hypothetical protein
VSKPAALRKRFLELSETQSWVLFSVSIFLFKIILFALDPTPKLYMGDSGSYLYTATSGWIPEDRSYLYGFVIRWTALWTHSLACLLLFQLLASTVAALLFAAICRSIFSLRARWSYLLGLLCALDPLQLLYERYVMTEALSLCLYAAALYFSLRYIRQRRLADLAIIQAISVALIAFRMSFLMLVQIDTVLLPLLAFSGMILGALRQKRLEGESRWSPLRGCGGHLLASLALMLGLHAGYKNLTGYLAHREPAYLHATGITLLAALAPILEPADSPDPALADLISHGDEFEIKAFYLRNSQRFSDGRLVDRWLKLEPDPGKADKLARRTALHALLRDPIGVAGLAWQTYAIYWDIPSMIRCATRDFSFSNKPSDDLISVLADQFNATLDKDNETLSVLQHYYVAAWPYYFLILVAPIVAGLPLVRRFHPEFGTLLFIHISLMLAVTMLFGGESVRYFQPISYAMLLAIALFVASLQSAPAGAEVRPRAAVTKDKQNARLSRPAAFRALAKFHCS